MFGFTGFFLFVGREVHIKPHYGFTTPDGKVVLAGAFGVRGAS